METDRISTADREILGRCPNCDETIPTHNVLIRYRSAEGWPRTFAECPNCTDVVHPC